jgi:outer membrane biosynthesis protein TonB
MPPSTSRIGNSAARVERAASPLGMIGAVALHVGIVTATLFTWSHKLEISDRSPPVVPVDLVTIGEKTDIAPMVRVQPKEPPKEEDVQPPVPDTAQPVPAPAPKEEEAAPPPEETVSSEPVPKPPPVVPKTKPQPEQKKEKFDINNIMALLDRRAPAASAAPSAKVGDRTVRGFGAQNAMTMDLQDALRNQIAQCWSPPVGGPRAADMIVDFDVSLNPDGSVARATSDALTSSNSYTRAAASAAQRAIYTCAPYKLPQDRYSQWREIKPFHFDPRLMMGQ